MCFHLTISSREYISTLLSFTIFFCMSDCVYDSDRRTQNIQDVIKPKHANVEQVKVSNVDKVSIAALLQGFIQRETICHQIIDC